MIFCRAVCVGIIDSTFHSIIEEDGKSRQEKMSRATLDRRDIFLIALEAPKAS